MTTGVMTSTNQPEYLLHTDWGNVEKAQQHCRLLINHLFVLEHRKALSRRGEGRWECEKTEA